MSKFTLTIDLDASAEFWPDARAGARRVLARLTDRDHAVSFDGTYPECAPIDACDGGRLYDMAGQTIGQWAIDDNEVDDSEVAR